MDPGACQSGEMVGFGARRGHVTGDLAAAPSVRDLEMGDAQVGLAEDRSDSGQPMVGSGTSRITSPRKNMSRPANSDDSLCRSRAMAAGS
jgi:hypothetical protein